MIRGQQKSTFFTTHKYKLPIIMSTNNVKLRLNTGLTRLSSCEKYLAWNAAISQNPAVTIMAQTSGSYYPTRQQQFQLQSMGSETSHNPVMGGPAYSQQATMQVAYPVVYAVAPGYAGGYPVAPSPREENNTAMIAGAWSGACIIAVIIGCCCAFVVLIGVPFIVCLAFFPGEGRAKMYEWIVI